MKEAGRNSNDADFAALDVKHARTRVPNVGLLANSWPPKDSYNRRYDS
jgi:hypothetical protein